MLACEQSPLQLILLACQPSEQEKVIGQNWKFDTLAH